jgi:DNA-binding CsgD family transcriptional regulator
VTASRESASGDASPQAWPENLERIVGLAPDELILSWGLQWEQTDPAARDQLTRYVEMTREILDDQRSADREIAAHVSISRVLADWGSFEEDGTRLLGGLGGAIGFFSGTLWLPDSGFLAPRLTWSDSSLGDASELEAETLGLRATRGVGVVGRAWAREAPVCVPDVLLTADYRHREAAARAGVRGALAFPALYAGGVLAVLEFCSREECRPSARFTATMEAIGRLIGEFLARRQGQLRSSPLTRRELQVLQLAADGCSRSQTAERLTVSPSTVATHMKHIFERLGVGDRASAVAKGLRLGLIE